MMIYNDRFDSYLQSAEIEDRGAVEDCGKLLDAINAGFVVAVFS